MLKIKLPAKPALITLGRYCFSDDQLLLANDKIFIAHRIECEALEDVFEFELNEIVALMWTFEQGMLKTDIINSRLINNPIDKVWHASYLVNQKVRKPVRTRFCRMVHILNRLKDFNDKDD